MPVQAPGTDYRKHTISGIIWHRVRIRPGLLNPYSPWQTMKLEMKTQMLWMLYGFRITSPESQNNRRVSLYYMHRVTRCQSQTHPVPVTRRTQDEGRKTTSLRTTVVPGAGKRVSALPVSTGLLLHWRSGGAVHRVFLRSSLNCWFPLPGNGQRDERSPNGTADPLARRPTVENQCTRSRVAH